MKNIFTSMFFIILPFTLSAQSFQISHVNAQYYSYDKFTNDVYYADYFTWDLYVKNLNSSEIRICPFPSLPVFAHNSHKCVYGNYDSIFVYDYMANKTIKIADSVGYYEALDYTFSPNDDYLLFGHNYYSFEEDKVHYIDFVQIIDLEYEWSSDTTIIYSNYDIIFSFNFISNKYDTLLISPNAINFTGFTYNRNKNLLYYSIGNEVYAKIHSYDPVTQIDSVVFDASNFPNDLCWPNTYNIHCMEWSPDNERMAFFATVLDAGDTIYDLDSDSDQVHRYTLCGGEGYQYLISWLNKDTIIYFNATLGHIYGYILDNPLIVKQNRLKYIPVSFEVYSYPNPFNGSFTINLNGIIKNPEIIIYNVNGHEIKKFENISGSGNQFEQVWDGRNEAGQIVSSGVYFVIVRDKAENFSIKGTSKIVYLK